ncbi:MAG: N-acetyltransferase, partial [Acidobacteriota bacterium]
FSSQALSTSTGKIIPWESRDLESAAKIVAASYKNQADAEIYADYRTVWGCESYLRSIVKNPGCGTFMPETSFMALDQKDNPCGLILGCRISDGIGMIPQIAVHPSCQGKFLGNTLMLRSLEKYKLMGFNGISLAVTPGNRRAYEWYRRLGFKIRKQFGAYIWER